METLRGMIEFSVFSLGTVTPMSHALRTTVIDSQPPTTFGMPSVHSPLSLNSEQLLNVLLTIA
ncbi:hypothetical protein M407DRAFT_29257 [Tulasnella calospora MUT 4182]|uniref:Uncharacterized protein n=1 Tax=Tulasnella calospora MUT 4182 TaxID=1051891 RepID=A0A0C3KHZ6_9AGAM|nr:hypothetical protein M407DRAFT_29257 [Tulasnella calospora MUT 4182]